jgi:hypothetical protein
METYQWLGCLGLQVFLNAAYILAGIYLCGVLVLVVDNGELFHGESRGRGLDG